MTTAAEKREQAKALYLQGVAIAEIARRLEMSRKQVQRWKTADEWDALKLPKPERPKVVTFERPRGEPAPVRERPPLPASDYGTVEGLLLVLDEAIVQARVELASPTVPQNFGAAVNGLCKLIDMRLKLAPLDGEALLSLVLSRYRTPSELRDFFVQLKGAEWQGKSR